MADRHTVVSDPFTAKLIRIKAAQLCRRSDFSRSDYDDLRQGMVAYLIEKAHFFDPDRGNIESFVTTAINTFVRMELRFRSQEKRSGNLVAVSLEQTEVGGRDRATALRDAAGERDGCRRTATVTPDAFESVDLTDAVGHAMSRLRAEDRDLVEHVAQHGWSSASREWTRRMGRPICRRWIERRLASLRSAFEDAGLGLA